MYLLVDLIAPADGGVVEGIEGAAVVPRKLGGMKADVGLHGLVESIH